MKAVFWGVEKKMNIGWRVRLALKIVIGFKKLPTRVKPLFYIVKKRLEC